MTHAKHTPGPWRIGGGMMRAAHERHVVRGANLEYVARVDGAVESQANAHLIAAAPDLLAVARAYVATMNALGLEPADHEYRSMLERAELAIAKAEGR